MIYVTGDCHADFTKFNTKIFYEQKEMTKNDTLIICGDFGGIWDYQGESKQEKYELNLLNSRSFTTVFVDGNHECHPRLFEYPEDEWNGGRVHVIRPSVFHLMRGEIFNIEGKSFFTFGGASSHDVKDGILDPVKDKALIKEYRHDYFKEFRINGVSWWKEELPNDDEMEHGLQNLKDHDNKVDFIITHCAPSDTVALISNGIYKPDILTAYFQKIKETVSYKKWFFGHYHMDKAINAEEIVLYDQIIRIN